MGILTRLGLTRWPQHGVLPACACTLHCSHPGNALGSLPASQGGCDADLMALSMSPFRISWTMPFTSPPAQKAFPPAPFRMTACTSGLISQSSYSRCRVSHMAWFSAFRALGL